ncbi:sodium/solute symporter [candidate division KSB1 bacterium]|nr:sodium/solute symporter [candidate division KSB1 bacterium]
MSFSNNYSLLQLHSGNFSRRFFLIILSFLFLIFEILIAATGQSDLNYERFIAQFDSNQQKIANQIWASITDSLNAVKKPLKGTKIDGIPDSTLFEELTISNKIELLEKIKSKREQLIPLIEEQRQLLLADQKWSLFVEAAEKNPLMGKIYLKALSMAQNANDLLIKQDKSIHKIEHEISELRVNASLSQISLSFTWQDWLVIVIYLIFTTIMGAMLAGKQSSIKDFFLGGRKLPWTAVSGSIIATEISAATFLIAPAIVFSKGGDITYLQMAFGTIIARFVIGYFFIPAYYEREIYSPYDYMGNQLGYRVKKITSALFMVGAILAQGARVYIAAKALQVVTGTDITLSIILIGAVSMLWTIIGGITTVIWTDAIQFLIFAVGAILALVYVSTNVEGGFFTAVLQGFQAGKFNLINLNFNAKEAYTLWCGLFASGFLTLASHGTDQLMAQRMFTCKNANEARKAVIWSSASVLITALLLFVGAGIFVYYRHIPLNMPEQVIVNDDSMKIFAIYIVQVMPPILSGLLMAGLFSTAISTLESVLAALTHSTVDVIYRPYFKPNAADKHYVTVSRVMIIFWGIFLVVFAIYCDTISKAFADLIQFALAMAAYTYGALLGTFLMAFLPTNRDDLGLMWGVPLSMLTIFAFNWHTTATQIIVAVACFILIVQAFRHLQHQPAKILYIAIASGVVMLISMAVIGYTPEGAPVYINLAWPWHFPIGTAMTLSVGYLVGNPKN